jgi:hypothetical protein
MKDTPALAAATRAGASPTQRALRGLLAAGLLALGLLAVARADEAVASASPRSGDAWVDAMLLDIDRYAARYPDAFTDELVRYDSAPRALVADLLADPQWTPGDLYFACALGHLTGQPCRAVAQRWEQDHALGWGAIAQEFGVAPQSSAFERLKRGIVLSYQRWARPLQVDASLHAEFPALPLAAPLPAGKAADHAGRATPRSGVPPSPRAPKGKRKGAA